MEENIALNKRKQKGFKASVEKFKQLLRAKNHEENKEETKTKPVATSDRGIVYLSNIPHGFYEIQMQKYFSQFGKVTRLRLARSAKTGRSKGFGFIEFKVPEVAKIVAETMNGYLMCKRLLKAHYIPPEDQNKKYFYKKNYTEKRFPKLLNRTKQIKMNNSKLSVDLQEVQEGKIRDKIRIMGEKLKKAGIDYDTTPIFEVYDSDISFKTPQGFKKIIRTKNSEESSVVDESASPVMTKKTKKRIAEKITALPKPKLTGVKKSSKKNKSLILSKTVLKVVEKSIKDDEQVVKVKKTKKIKDKESSKKLKQKKK